MKFGRFVVRMLMNDRHFEDVMKTIGSQVAIVRCELMAADGAFHCDGICNAFDDIMQGSMIPEYDCTISWKEDLHTQARTYSIKWKRKP